MSTMVIIYGSFYFKASCFQFFLQKYQLFILKLNIIKNGDLAGQRVNEKNMSGKKGKVNLNNINVITSPLFSSKP